MANITSENLLQYCNSMVGSHSRTMYAEGGYPLVQAAYGTYDSKATAHKVLCLLYGDFDLSSTITINTPCTSIPRGFTVAIEENNTVVEYQYKKVMPVTGYTGNDLEVKSVSTIDANDVTYSASSAYNNGTIGKAVNEGITNTAIYYANILSAMSNLSSGEAVSAQVALNTATINSNSQVGNNNSNLIENKVNALINCIQTLVSCVVFHSGTPFILPQELNTQLSLLRYYYTSTTPAICGQAICGQTICGTI